MILSIAAGGCTAAALLARFVPKSWQQAALHHFTTEKTVPTAVDIDVELAASFQMQTGTFTYHVSSPILPILFPLIAHFCLCFANAVAYATQGEYPIAGLAAGLALLEFLAMWWLKFRSPIAPICILLAAILAWPMGLYYLDGTHSILLLLLQGTFGWLFLAYLRCSIHYWAVYCVAWLACIVTADLMRPISFTTCLCLLLNVFLPGVLLVAVLYVGVLISDTDAQARNDAYMEEIQTMQSCIATKSGLLGTLAHEVRTPLNAMMQSVTLLQGTSLTSDQQMLTECIMECGEQVKSNVTSVLEFLRIRNGKVRLNSRPFVPHELCHSCLSMVRHSAQRKGLQLRTDFTGCCNGLLIGDAARLKQVLANLLSNAIKFVAEGHVLLLAKMVKGPGGTMVLRVEVSDTGCGITTADQEKLFSPFQQANNHTWEQHGGSGLGLCICKELVDLMGGRIGIDPERTHVGLGSCFFVELTLPYVPPVQKPVASPISLDTMQPPHHLSFNLSTKGDSIPFPASWTFPALSCSRNPIAPSLSDSALDLYASSFVMSTENPEVLVDPAEGIPLRRLSGVNLLVDTERWNSSLRHSAPAPSPTMRTKFAEYEVLLADDNDINRAVMGRILQTMGFASVHLARDGQEAVQLWRAHTRIRFIVLDYHMPKLNGIEAAQQIRADMGFFPGRCPPCCILLSGDDDAGCEFQDGEFAACLTKPATRQQLEDVMDHALRPGWF